MNIGIITMHKVLNYGSALQAFALQHVIESMGYDCDLIDYDFNANKGAPERKKGVKHIISYVLQLCLGFPAKKKEEKFNTFYKDHFKLSQHRYNSSKDLHAVPPIYDLFCTGSDQVWNPRFIESDTSFMLSFVPESKPRVSYAASFATNDIPLELQPSYIEHLSKYNKIYVREYSNVDLIKKLTGKDANVVCDPTLLLSSDDWLKALDIKDSESHSPYILVYILSYMYNPYPEIYNVVKYVKKILGYKVVIFGGKTKDAFTPGYKCIKDAGPKEFVTLFKNASFVITDSFHGSAFASIFGIPMLACLKSRDSVDGRIPTLLSEVGGEHSIVAYNDNLSLKKEELLSLHSDSEKLKQYRDRSKDLLSELLRNNI